MENEWPHSTISSCQSDATAEISALGHDSDSCKQHCSVYMDLNLYHLLTIMTALQSWIYVLNMGTNRRKLKS